MTKKLYSLLALFLFLMLMTVAAFAGNGNGNPGGNNGGGSGTVTSIATSSPLSGGTITTTGTLSCPTCVASASSWAQGDILYYSGSAWFDLPAGTVDPASEPH